MKKKPNDLKDAKYWAIFFHKQPLNKIPLTLNEINRIIKETRLDALKEGRKQGYLFKEDEVRFGRSTPVYRSNWHD